MNFKIKSLEQDGKKMFLAAEGKNISALELLVINKALLQFSENAENDILDRDAAKALSDAIRDAMRS